MSPDKRNWKCPECGSQVELSIFQLDPLACDACLAKRKSGGNAGRVAGQDSNAANRTIAQTSGLPDVVKLAAALIVGLLVGLPIGFITGRVTAPQSSQPREHSSRQSPPLPDQPKPHDLNDDGPDESTRPGPGYKWVRGYTRKDGTKVNGHWAKDPSRKH